MNTVLQTILARLPQTACTFPGSGLGNQPEHRHTRKLVTCQNDLAQERLTLASIRCRLNTAAELPEMELSADVRHSLYRAAKAALNNAIKHG